MVTTKDSNDYVRVLLYSYYTTTTGWGILLLEWRDEEHQKVGGPTSGTTPANTARVMHEGVMHKKGTMAHSPSGFFRLTLWFMIGGKTTAHCRRLRPLEPVPRPTHNAVQRRLFLHLVCQPRVLCIFDKRSTLPFLTRKRETPKRFMT